MEKDKLTDEKNQILKEIMDLRSELSDLSEKINNVGKSVSFFNFFLIPLAIALVISLIVRAFGVRGNEEVGIFIMTFVIAIIVTTVYDRKKVKQEKDKLIEKRLKLQRLIVKKSQRLAEIENELKA